MSVQDKVHSALWGMAGMLLVGAVTTAIDNKAAIASLDAKVIEVDALGEKLDKVNIQLADLSGRMVGMRTDIQRLELSQQQLQRQNLQNYPNPPAK